MSALFAVYMPTCATPQVRPTVPQSQARIAELWQQPDDLASRDLFYGPFGEEQAPDASATYTFVKRKQQGTNPGMTVTDQHGREWHVKQPSRTTQGAEGPVEVVLSRVLSAVGYHQPPVYFLNSFTLTDSSGTHTEVGGRFRLHDKSLKDTGQWSWQQNPFVGTRPYQGLLVILMMFDSSDLKNVNNTLYEVKEPHADAARWYVVRDLGTALGETGRIAPRRNDPSLFERNRFITDVTDGFVTFDYHGWHQELFQRRITPEDVAWACELVGGLSDRQWHDAFRAAGYEPAVADRFIGQLQQRIAAGRRLSQTTVSFRASYAASDWKENSHRSGGDASSARRWRPKLSRKSTAAASPRRLSLLIARRISLQSPTDSSRSAVAVARPSGIAWNMPLNHFGSIFPRTCCQNRRLRSARINLRRVRAIDHLLEQFVARLQRARGRVQDSAIVEGLQQVVGREDRCGVLFRRVLDPGAQRFATIERRRT